jgi:hypothetical protein
LDPGPAPAARPQRLERHQRAGITDQHHHGYYDRDFEGVTDHLCHPPRLRQPYFWPIRRDMSV